jgi:diguanylate cyclase (GGDEF)-like protein
MVSKVYISGYIRSFIRHHGGIKTVAVGTVMLLLPVLILTVIIDLLLYGTVHSAPVYFAALITLLAGPVILYFFVDLIIQLDRSEEKLRALSIMDDMTDVYNRRYFLEQVDKELAKAQRYGTAFSIVVMDVDHLRQINDDYGYSAGDAVLQSLANTCMNNLRTMDIFARLGDGSFAFMIPEADKTDVIAFAKKVLQAVEETAVGFGQQELRITVSMGMQACDGSSRNLDALLKDALDALDEAKTRGRNCIVVCDSEQNPGQDMDEIG